MRLLLGEETHVEMHVNTDVASTDTEVTERSLVGKRLAELRVWEQYNVVITRIRRQGLELTATETARWNSVTLCAWLACGHRWSSRRWRAGSTGASKRQTWCRSCWVWCLASSSARSLPVAERHCDPAGRGRWRLPGQSIGRPLRADRPLPALCACHGQESLAAVGSDAFPGRRGSDCGFHAAERCSENRGRAWCWRAL